MYDRRATLRLFWPVLVEQTFAVTINFLATLMVRGVSEDAMAGVGLVGILNILVMNAFSAVSAGVSVVVSQCIGRQDPQTAGRVGSQSVTLVLYLSAGIGGAMALAAGPILRLLFGSSEPGVLDAARIFFVHSCLSMPLLALFTVLSGIARSTGNARLPMFCSVLSNIAYLSAGALLISRWGVHGAGFAMDFSRLVPAVFMGLFMLRGKSGIYLERLTPRLDRKILSPVLKIAVPSGVDSIVFNGGKLIVSVFMSGMGTPVIAANSIANNLSSISNLPGTALQIMTVTTTGYAFGKGDAREARRQIKRATLWGIGSLCVTSAILFAFLTPVLNLFDPSQETFRASREVMLLLAVTTPLFWPTSFITPQGLRACNDAVFTMWVSVVSMIVLRVLGSWFLGVRLDMGLFGIWLAMVVDWVARSALFVPRAAGQRRYNRPS
ncbi:MAG: MATE family efflux transporter [Oscillospiraceae bacterium]|nr:MATE family efflux transporter [Oscillospiraceae bacterium]